MNDKQFSNAGDWVVNHVQKPEPGRKVHLHSRQPPVGPGLVMGGLAWVWSDKIGWRDAYGLGYYMVDSAVYSWRYADAQD